MMCVRDSADHFFASAAMSAALHAAALLSMRCNEMCNDDDIEERYLAAKV